MAQMLEHWMLLGGSEFNSHLPHGCSKPSVNPVPRNLAASTPQALGMHVVHRRTHVPNTHS